MTTADRIKQRRLELGLTQLEVAKRIGLTTKAAVCKIEKQGNDVTLKNVEKFAAALNCTPAYLMGWEDNLEPENDTNDTEQTKRFIAYYEKLNPEQRIIVDNLLAALVKKK